jgi:3-hydroxy-9,10-secoandrosta-1,3,5(10)-triene-9,17-dione monooxygenase reductase component
VTSGVTPEDPLAPVSEPLGEGTGAPFGQGAGDAARYRQVLGHFATGVTVVTTATDGVPAGLAVNSFTSVSLEPPLVAFCVARTSSTWPQIRAVGSFCVNVLAEDQENLCRVFATSGADKFRGVGWRTTESGAPILAGALAWIDCSVEAEHAAGDHFIVVGRVRELGVAREGRPLVFYRGGYGRFEP